MMVEAAASTLVDGVVEDAAVMVLRDEDDGVGDDRNEGCPNDVAASAELEAVAVEVEVGEVMRAGAPARRSRSELEDDRDGVTQDVLSCLEA